MRRGGPPQYDDDEDGAGVPMNGAAAAAAKKPGSDGMVDRHGVYWAQDSAVARMYRCGWATLPFALGGFLAVLTALIIWSMVSIMPNAVETVSNAAHTSASVSARADAYLNRTDALMVYVNPSDVQRFAAALAQTGLAGLPYVGNALSDLASKSGTVINWTAAAVAVSDIIDLIASSATQTKQRGLTITLLQPQQQPQQPPPT